MAAITLSAMLAAAGAQAADATRERFGQLPDGAAVEAVTLSNSHGLSVRIIAYGAAIQSLKVPDRHGKTADVVLAYPDMNGYLAKPQYFGATVGRYANRIAGGTFALDGQRVELTKNDGANALHGGVRGFDKQLWTISEVKHGPTASVTLTRVSHDGEEGYPGAVKASITYALNERNELVTTYAATTDKPTVINMSNHSLFNLAGVADGRDALGETLTIAADTYTPVNSALIPTGELRPVAGTPFDFRNPHVIGERIRQAKDPQLTIGRGYDHNWVLRGGVTRQPRFAARLADPKSGRVMELWTTEPGVQFYSGNFLDGTSVGADHILYRQGDGLALEPQHFPDSPNQPTFPSTRLNPGETYRHLSIYRFSNSEN